MNEQHVFRMTVTDQDGVVIEEATRECHSAGACTDKLMAAFKHYTGISRKVTLQMTDLSNHNALIITLSNEGFVDPLI